MKDRATVLYVDDNAKSNRLLTSVLEECGFQVIAETDPIHALQQCRQISFDVALLDYDMPGMKGADLAREIKFLMPQVPVVLLSGVKALPPTELIFVDAYFGSGTALDDLLWTIRGLTSISHPAMSRHHAATVADST
jgi:CheY-like chemotaxis protein